MTKDMEYDYICCNDNVKVTLTQKGFSLGLGRLLHHAFRQVDICNHETGEIAWSIYESAEFYTATATISEVLEDF